MNVDRCRLTYPRGHGILDRHGLAQRLVVVCFIFRGRHIANRFEQPPMIEPVYPVERGERPPPSAATVLVDESLPS